MNYDLSHPLPNLGEALKAWLRLPRTKTRITADIRSATEVRLTPLVTLSQGLRSSDDVLGCTLSVRGLSLVVACAPSLVWIERTVISLIRQGGVSCTPWVASKPKAWIKPMAAPENVRPRQISTPRRKQTQVVRCLNYPTVESACLAAERDAVGWIKLTDRAKTTAKDSNFIDPDYIYDALMALGRAAKLNANGGLGMSWEHYLKRNGAHDYCAHSSEGTLAQFSKVYHVAYMGSRYCIESHIRCGTGNGCDSARIYVAQPHRPGQPVIVGQVGAHLPILARCH
jgi:hypothetical protein